MKKIFAIVMTVLLIVSAMCVFSAVSYAEGDTDASIGNIPTTLSLPAGENYAFYAQTRMSRYDLSKYDLRILCVVKESWFKQIDNFVATFTFTDGKTPISLKKIGFNTVFESITVFGKSGMTETYVAAEGTLILGMTITEMPADYADVAQNKPTISVVTDNSVKAETVPPAIDYETPVQSMTDLDVTKDGVVYFANIQEDGQIGTWRRQNNRLLTSRATYLVTGNYEGYYDLTVTYTDTDGFNIAVIVNDTLFVLPITGTMKTNSWNLSAAKKATITVPMIKGTNTITFTAIDWASANLIDFDLTKNENFGESKTYQTSAKDHTSLTGTASLIPCLAENGAEAGKIAQLAGQSGSKIGTASYSLNGVEKGKYLLLIDYLTSHNDREFHVYVDNKAAQKIKVMNTGSNNEASALSRAAMYIEIPEGAETLNFKAYDWELGLYGYTLIRVSDEITETPSAPLPDVDYDTVVLVKDDINVATDGVVSGASIQADGQIGQMRDSNNASATYTLYGNYEGYYDVIVAYTDTDGYVLTVSVNGKVHSIHITGNMRTKSWNTSDAKTVTITVPMVKGENLINFSAPTGTWSPNIVDFDLVRNDAYDPNAITTKYATDAKLNNAQLEPLYENGVEVAKAGGYIGNSRSASFELEAPAAGQYMLVINYLTNANNRKFNISLDGGTADQYLAPNSGSNVEISAVRSLIICYDLSAGKHTFTFGGSSDWNPNIHSVSLVPIN